MIETYKERKLFKGQEVQAYFNLHKHVFSLKGQEFEQYEKTFSVIRQDKKGKKNILAHGNGIVLVDCNFKVNETGRQKVLQEKRKNVHAFVTGQYVKSQEKHLVRMDKFKEAYYNPYKQNCFTDKETGEKLTSAQLVYLVDKKIYYVA